ncbi:hypothetical protein HBI25_190180 [Parastagonospora nodorum]|nr:hypothetical protein HBH47_004960 [Parastagonospora nodorum]KAH5427883.1 hypothetical protein HBI46_034600 [Parastagonospora nodorum]KAH5549019.1 hypothetical protein HBI27_027660 [Parastagonospora nodorum]KAH5550759.1 hypothetical protein HBI25_190180 [Parastagonospora nodorum]KAH5574581.1 hypothetical protein HBI24_194940 [Parastagonospora nodorum]
MAASNSTPTPVPFPQPKGIRDPGSSDTPPDSPGNTRRQRTSTNASAISNRVRTASLKLMEANPPPGMWAATGATASKAPSLADIRRGSYGSEGWSEDTQRKRAGSRTSQEKRAEPSRHASGTISPLEGGVEAFPAVTEEDMRERPSGEAMRETQRYESKHNNAAIDVELRQSNSIMDKKEESAVREPLTGSGEYANGYVPPPKLPWKRSFAIGMRSFWKWFLTPAGFLITIYALNVVAWGGMLFLLLCNAAPAMCTPTCDDINSPRRKWVEYDSQILNSLFCVTGFGLAPWRFRDLYWWGWWRMGGSSRKEIGIRRLAGIHQGWFRLPGSQQLPELADAKSVDPDDPAVPIPAKSIPDPPPTGMRAPPTKSWKMDFVLWMNASNTFFQVILCFYMWHYNRIERPSWATGLFVALGCIVAGVGGIMMWHEGKNIKKVEGVPMRKDYNDTPMNDVERRSVQNIPLVSNPGGAAKS